MRVLVPSSALPFVELAGQRWALRDVPEAGDGFEYTCASYAWGPGRVPHPFAPGETISDRALPVLDAVVRGCAPKAVWIDGLCMPTEEPALAESLRRLGEVYGRATEVAIVLSERALPLFECYAARRPLDDATLANLEREPWVQRFWTYQELARSQRLRFLIERGSDVAIDGSEFLNHVGQALYDRQRRKGGACPYPALDNLMDVLGSWLHTGSEPFAYQVMAGMAQRFGEHAADRFNAVLGAIAPAAALEGSSDVASASERFMTACEAKGDLSFVYSSARRSPEPGRSVRPVAGDLPPLIAWHTYGEGQRGSVEPKLVRLHDLSRLPPAPLGDSARAFIEDWLSHSGVQPSGALAARAFEQLRQMGFTGAGGNVELGSGYFFPVTEVATGGDCVVLVATQVRWVHGAPALMVEPAGEGRYRVRAVGVFVGSVAAEGDTYELV